MKHRKINQQKKVQTKNRKKQSHYEALKGFTAVILFIGILSLFSGFTKPYELQAKGTEQFCNEFIKYKSLTVEQGDSLWSIAEEYKTGVCNSTQEYVAYIKELNQMKYNTVYSGDTLIIAYNTNNILIN